MPTSSIALLLQLVITLISSNPTPQNLALAQQAVTLATQYLAAEQVPVQVSDSTVSYSVPTTTDSQQPVVINVTQQAPQVQPQVQQQESAPLDIQTPELTSVPFSSIVFGNNPLFSTGPHDANLLNAFDFSRGPMDVTVTLTDNASTAVETYCSTNSAKSCSVIQSNTVNDPAAPDGLWGNMHFGGLESGTAYGFEIDVTGNGWEASTTGAFVTQ